MRHFSDTIESQIFWWGGGVV